MCSVFFPLLTCWRITHLTDALVVLQIQLRKSDLYFHVSTASSSSLFCSGFVCVPYNGTVCKEALGSALVFYDLGKTSYATSELLMSNFRQVFLQSRTSRNCLDFAYPLVCHYVFPPCRLDVPVPTPRPICKGDCLTSSLELCPSVWNAVLRVIEIVNTAHLGKPTCDPLPYMNGGDESECIGMSDLLPPGDRVNTIPTGKDVSMEARVKLTVAFAIQKV